MKTFCKFFSRIYSIERNFECDLWERKYFVKDPRLNSFPWQEKMLPMNIKLLVPVLPHQLVQSIFCQKMETIFSTHF